MFARAYPNPQLAEEWPDVYLGMGLTAENLAERHGIGREESDQFSLQSHRKATAAIAEGKFSDEIVPLSFTLNRPGKANALNQVMLHQLHDIFVDAATNRDLRALTITGSGGRVFCGGADLTEVSFDPDDPSQAIWDDMARALAAFWDDEQP